MTEKIYEKQSYLRELVTAVTENTCEDGHIYVKLKETVLFPEEGKQEECIDHVRKRHAAQNDRLHFE